MTGIQRHRYSRIFLGFLIIFCLNSSISPLYSHSGYQSSLRSSASSDDSWEIIWKDDFEITHIWGDDSHLFTGAQYGYYGSYVRNKILIQKWDKNSNVLKNYTWDPDFENVYLEGIWGNTNSVSISGYLVDSFIDANDTISYANGFLLHFDKNLALKWIRTWNDSLAAGFFDIWCN